MVRGGIVSAFMAIAMVTLAVLLVQVNAQGSGLIELLENPQGNLVVDLSSDELRNTDLSDIFDIEIFTQTKSYKYLGQLLFPLNTNLPVDNVIRVLLYNKTTGILIESKNNNVYGGTGFNNNTPLNEGEKKCDSSFVGLRDSEFNIGESVSINILNKPESNTYTELQVINEDKVYKMFDAPKEATFIPDDAGFYRIQYFCNNNFMNEVKFEVIQANLFYFPLGFKTFNLVNSFGEIEKVKARNKYTYAGEFVTEFMNPTRNVRSIGFKDINDQNPTLRMEEVSNVFVGGEPAVSSYAIDPTLMNFSQATITAKAQGTALYKCRDYDFDNQICFGSWEKVRDIVPGEEYRFTLTPEDPLFSELNSSLSCSCEDSVVNMNSGSLNCNVFCAHTINIPENATSFYLQSITFTAVSTISPDSTTISNSNQNGYYDHNQNHTDADDAYVGSGTTTSTTTYTWTNNSIDSTGARSFTNLDCSNWPNYCVYYAYINSSMDFQSPGQSKKDPSMNISLTSINYTINYTLPGTFSVLLNTPGNNEYTNNFTVLFNYTPTNGDYNILNCSLYTNETSWSEKNYSTNITNGTTNLLSDVFSTDGSYLWNVVCFDTTNASTTAPSNYTIIVDTTDPTVLLVSPNNGDTYTSSNIVNFFYNVSDTSPINNCSLLIDGSNVDTDTSVTKDTNQTFVYNLANGVYEWGVMCFDNAGNQNVSVNNTLNVSVPPKILTGEWYETYTLDCSDKPCQISVAQQTDGTSNYVASTLISGQTEIIVNATSDYVGSNGGVIGTGSTVDFSSFFQTIGDNGVTARWYLYYLNSTGGTNLICSDTTGTGASSGSTSTGACTLASTIKLESDDRFLYDIEFVNGAPNRDKTYNHTIDYSTSYFNVTNFTQLGTLSTKLISPVINFSILQGDSFNLVCNSTCTTGSCLGVDMYAQINTSGTWTNVSSSGVLALNDSETNPHLFGTLYNGTNTTTFQINASSAGTTYVSCFADSLYQADYSELKIKVSVQNNQPPTVDLNYPGNDTWINSTDIQFQYTPSTLGILDNCSLYIDEAFNQTNSTPLANGGINNFTVNGLQQLDYNWSVSCADTTGLIGNSSVYYFYIDVYKPSNLTLNNPPDLYSTTDPNVLFNWTAYDNRASNLDCNLTINGTVNQSVTVINSTPYNITVGTFDIGTYYWNVSCIDYAGNLNISETRNFTVNDEGPKVNLYDPGNNTGVNTTTPILIYNASDNYALAECSLYINGAFNQTNKTSLINGFNNFTTTLQEAWYNWSVACRDNNGNNASTSNFTFRVDTTFPSVDLVAPTPAQLFNDSSITFTYNASDYAGSQLSCSIYVDGLLNISSTATSGVNKNEPGSGYSDGFHDWNATCSDFANNTNSSETRNFTINQTPYISLGNPENNSHISGAVNLYYTPSDNDGFENCSLFLNGIYNISNSTLINNTQTNNFTVVGLSEGYYNWSVECYDSGIYSNYNMSENKTFIADNTLPVVNLSAPNNTFVIEQESYSFNWSVTDNFATGLLCDIYVNGTVNVSNVSSPNGGVSNYTINGLRTGSYNWSVACLDNASLTGYSETWNYSVLLPPRVNLTNPQNYTADVFTTVTFSYIPDLGSGSFPNCTLMLNGQSNLTNYSIIPEQENNITVDLPEGRYDWNVLCYDSNDLSNQADYPWTYFVDTQPPFNITLIYPGNLTTVTRNNISFTFVSLDSVTETMQCGIDITDDISTYRLVDGLNVTNATNYTYYNTLSDGNYLWNVTCIDAAGNENTSSVFNFTVDAPPNVTLIFPDNYFWNNTGDIDFIYTPYDDIQIKNCSLYLNGIEEVNDTSILKNQNNTLSITNKSSGEYNWTVGCYDSDDNLFMPVNRTLYIDRVEPTITLNDPGPAELSTSSSILFNWTPIDNLAFNLTCDLIVNGTVNQSNITIANGDDYNITVPGFADGLFYWNVSCTDQAQTSNSSLTRNFSVQEPPSVSLGLPGNGTRDNATIQIFYYTPTDNSGSINECILIINGLANVSNSSSITNDQEQNFTLTSLTNGNYSWDVNCSDPSGNVGNNGTPNELYLDLQGPYIELYYPGGGDIFNQEDIFFNWTPTDFNTSVNITCDLFVTDGAGDRLVENISGFSGTVFNTTVLNLTEGSHDWNVTCTDNLGNTNASETRSFTINQPDLYLNSSGITFSNNNPSLYEEINITANVSNIGGLTVNNVYVEFWDEDPAVAGIQIGNDTNNVAYNSSALFVIPWNITPGYHTIYVLVDPNNVVGELNETNNNATQNISAFHVNITYPQNNTVTNDNAPRIDFNTSDFTGNNINYTIFVDDTANGQSGTVSDGANTSISLNSLADGIHLIIVQGEDTLGRIKNSTHLTITIDTAAPVTTFITPNASWYSINTVNISYNITDNFSSIITYNVFLDDVFNHSNTTNIGERINNTFNNLAEGEHSIIIEATDELGNVDNSTLLIFYVDLTSPSANITTSNESWFNTPNPLINFNVTDNLDTVLNYALFVNDSANVSGSANNASAASNNLDGLTNGSYSIILEAYDDAGWYTNSSPIIIYIDSIEPGITLDYPGNNTNNSNTTIDLNFTVTDNMADYLICNLTLDGSVVGKDLNVNNGVQQNVTVSNLNGGYHYWNVTCNDRAANSNISLTYQFYVEQPDLFANGSAIYFSNNNPIENETTNLTATIQNIGTNDAFDFVVQFWQGNPSTGMQINGNTTMNLTAGQSQNVTVNFTVSIGPTEVFLVVDAPLATNGSVAEENESNNIASANITVGLWHFVYGDTGDKIVIEDAVYSLLYDWDASTSNGSNIFVADSDSSIEWTLLQAIGRNTSNGTAFSDYADLDVKLNSTNYTDSVNSTYTSGSQPIEVRTYNVYDRIIENVSIFNSTNNTNFKTGILWDYSDGGNDFNGTQDVLFISEMSEGIQGYNETVDFEIRIPATLRNYIGVDESSVVFYIEIN